MKDQQLEELLKKHFEKEAEHFSVKQTAKEQPPRKKPGRSPLSWKKWVLTAACFLAVAGILAAAALPDVQDVPVVSEAGTEGSTSSNCESTNSEVSLKDPVISDVSREDPVGEYAQLYYYDYAEYLHFLDTAKLPEDFVSYEEISMLGKFDGFVCLDGTKVEKGSSLFYSFKTDNGWECNVYVYHEERESLLSPLLEEVLNKEDLRTLREERKGYFMIDGMTYGYTKGKLISVKWEDEGIIFVLYSSYLSECPESHPAFGLFSADTAKATAESVYTPKN
jgi:hypothetical protein